MSFRSGPSAALLATSLAGTCSAQSTRLHLLKTENFDLLSRAESSPGVPNPDNTFWIGHNPSCIAYGCQTDPTHIPLKAACRIRTRDLRFTKALLYQLS